MYTIQDVTYAEAGYILENEKFVGFSALSTLGPFTEKKINLSKVSVKNGFISFGGLKWVDPGIRTYAEAKRFIIGKRYSNDDQIAIILNKEDSEDDALEFEKMQEWREWASTLAHKIIENLNTE